MIAPYAVGLGALSSIFVKWIIYWLKLFYRSGRYWIPNIILFLIILFTSYQIMLLYFVQDTKGEADGWAKNIYMTIVFDIFIIELITGYLKL